MPQKCIYQILVNLAVNVRDAIDGVGKINARMEKLKLNDQSIYYHLLKKYFENPIAQKPDNPLLSMENVCVLAAKNIIEFYKNHRVPHIVNPYVFHVAG